MYELIDQVNNREKVLRKEIPLPGKMYVNVREQVSYHC